VDKLRIVLKYLAFSKILGRQRCEVWSPEVRTRGRQRCEDRSVKVRWVDLPIEAIVGDSANLLPADA